MMSVEANKKIIEEMFRAQLAGDMDSYGKILADDLQWEIMQFGIERPRSKEEMMTMLGAVHRSLGGGKWEKRATSMVGEGDRLAVEAEAMMELSNGNIYRNRYHYLYRLRDGQVFFAREYLDTHAAVEAFKGMPSTVPADD